MKIEITHITEYGYEHPAVDSVNELRLTPRTNAFQSCYHHDVCVEPSSPTYSYDDYFGNRVHVFSVNEPHTSLSVRTTSTVVTVDKLPSLDEIRAKALPAEEVLDMLGTESFEDKFAEYLLPTVYTESDVPFGFDEAVYPGTVLYDWLLTLSETIRLRFRYDPGVTHVHGKVTDTIRLQRGVCQDFAHLMIAVCRNNGVPARYVSGYHFVGDLLIDRSNFTQASHAWVEAYVPGAGWLAFDPTNPGRVDGRYIKLGHGRDYADIVPLKGVYSGIGAQVLNVTVDVRKIEE